jgi:hypothetical protein
MIVCSYTLFTNCLELNSNVEHERSVATMLDACTLAGSKNGVSRKERKGAKSAKGKILQKTLE